jgi:hypothetical protein
MNEPTGQPKQAEDPDAKRGSRLMFDKIHWKQLLDYEPSK